MLKAKQKTVSLVVACLATLLTVLFAFAMLFAPTPMKTASAADTEIVFALGANGSATHIDGSSNKTTYSETNGGYTLSLTGGTNMYPSSYDAKGNSCIKLGSSSKTGGFNFTVPDDVTSVTIAIGKYKANTSKITINGTAYTLTNSSDDGAYDVITVDTSSTKTVSLTTVSGGVRAMVNTITFVVESSASDCTHDDGTEWTWVYDAETQEHYKQCTACETEIEDTRAACEFSEEVNGTTATFTCGVCQHSYNAFQITYNYPNEVTLSGEETAWVEEGTKATLLTTTAPEGYVFAGWSTEKITEATTTKPTLYADYTVTEATTFYAVYHNEAVASGWNLVTNIADLATGDVVTIVAPSKNVAIGAKSNTSTVYFTTISITSADSVLTSTNTLTELTVTKNNNNTNQISFKTGTNYLSWSSGNSLTTSSSEYYWTVSISDSSKATTTTSIASVKDSSRKLQYNASTPRFACYTSTQTAVALYEYAEGGEISYTSVFCEHSETYTETEEATCTQDGATIVKCSNCDMEISREVIEATGHQNTTTTTVDATCTEDGATTVTCNACGETVSTTVIPATGHSLDEGVITTKPDVGVEGEMTYTCQNGCGYTETKNIPALDATKYTVSYSVPNGIEAVADSEPTAEGETIILPYANSTGIYTFLGWVTEEIDEQTTRPEVYAANSEYTVTDNVTLYALYSYVNPNAQGGYVKVTENLTDWSGEYLIIYETGKVAFNSSLATLDAVSNTVAVTITDGVIQPTDELNSIAFTVALVEGESYSIQAKNGQYIGKTANSNGLDASEKAYTNTFSIDASGNAVITASGNTTLRFNSAKDQLRFRYYKTGQQAVQLYKYMDATYYATNLGEVATIKNASVTIGEDLAMNYYVSNSNAEAVMYFTFNGKTYDVTGELQSDGRYKYTLTNIPPQCMTDNISVVLMNGEVELDKMEEYSVQTYAQNMLNKAESSDTLKQLLTDMLYYGAEAQTYIDYNTGKLATDDVKNLGTPSEANAPEVSAAPVKNDAITSYPAYFTGATVWFDSVNQIQVSVNTSENVTLTVDGVDVELTGTKYKTEGILATNFDKEYVFKLYYDGVLMQTLTYSVNAYAYKMKDHATMGNLATALYRYGVSAEAYKA